MHELKYVNHALSAGGGSFFEILRIAPNVPVGIGLAIGIEVAFKGKTSVYTGDHEHTDIELKSLTVAFPLYKYLLIHLSDKTLLQIGVERYTIDSMQIQPVDKNNQKSCQASRVFASGVTVMTRSSRYCFKVGILRDISRSISVGLFVSYGKNFIIPDCYAKEIPLQQSTTKVELVLKKGKKRWNNVRIGGNIHCGYVGRVMQNAENTFLMKQMR